MPTSTKSNVVSLAQRRIRKRLFAGEIDDATAAMLLALSSKPNTPTKAAKAKR